MTRPAPPYRKIPGRGTGFWHCSIARQTLEDQRATVGQDQGTVEVDQGAVAVARINLGYCRIVSPVSGRAGVRLVDPGNLVSANGSTASSADTASSTSNTAATTAGGSSMTSGSGIVVIDRARLPRFSGYRRTSIHTGA